MALTPPSTTLTRRDVLRAALGAPMAALVTGVGAACSRPGVPDGVLLDQGGPHAHAWLRDGAVSSSAWSAAAPQQRAGVVVVGAGVAGLSAAWRLARAGVRDVVVVELDEVAGGTARAGRSDVTAFPWGAHYVVAPDAKNRALSALLTEMGALDGVDDDGTPRVAEAAACREPEERHFRDGRFFAGLYPLHGETAAEAAERRRFVAELTALSARVDDDGARWFALPQARASRCAELIALDRQTFAAWLDERRFTSWRLRWLCDYACRDDYGCTPVQTSARAGLMYFCARRTGAASGDDVDGGRTVITWPEGNGRVIAHLQTASGARVLCGRAALGLSEVDDGDGAAVIVHTWGNDGPLALRAGHVVLAVPGFVAARLLPRTSASSPPSSAPSSSPSTSASSSPSTSAWAVVNLHLERRPRDRGRRFAAPMPWDTVFTDSASLGYVVATHQRGIDHGPTVLTWYRPLVDDDPAAARRTLASLSRADWADAALSELELAHPDIRDVVHRADVARLGHAMVRPTPGLWSDDRFAARALPRGRVFVAHTDLAGVALCEEALAAGVAAAEGILAARGAAVESLL